MVGWMDGRVHGQGNSRSGLCAVPLVSTPTPRRVEEGREWTRAFGALPCEKRQYSRTRRIIARSWGLLVTDPEAPLPHLLSPSSIRELLFSLRAMSSPDVLAAEALQRPRPQPSELLAQWQRYFGDPLLSLAALQADAHEGTLHDKRGLRSLSWRVRTALAHVFGW